MFLIQTFIVNIRTIDVEVQRLLPIKPWLDTVKKPLGQHVTHAKISTLFKILLEITNYLPIRLLILSAIMSDLKNWLWKKLCPLFIRHGILKWKTV